MVRICPKCSYIRQATDEAPEWQCPSCQVAYNKAGGPDAPANYGRYGAPVTVVKKEASSYGVLKWLIILLALGALALATKPMWHKKRPHNPARAAASGQPAITLYSTSWCGYCEKTRTFFDTHGIQYTELDIEKSTAGYEGHKKLGGGGIPVTVIGEDVIRGYSEERFRGMLQPWLKGT